MLKNFKLLIEYDGSSYHGWQIQKHERTIQGMIEAALKTMTAKKVTLIGSGRTDAGVHALGQVANFCCDTTLGAEEFKRGLNGLLAKDIVISLLEIHGYKVYDLGVDVPPAVFVAKVQETEATIVES